MLESLPDPDPDPDLGLAGCTTLQLLTLLLEGRLPLRCFYKVLIYVYTYNYNHNFLPPPQKKN